MKYLFLAVLLFTVQSFGWGDLGHQTVAEIAQRNLTKEAKEAVEAILGPEPLSIAATWPDVVRSDKRFSAFAPYHYAEVPVGKTYQSMDEHEHAQKDAMTVISKYPPILTDSKASREQKMIALRYIIHVVGDVHQPLHIGNGQDMGANLCLVIWKDPLTKIEEKTNLHSVWDTAMLEYEQNDLKAKKHLKYFGYSDLANEIIKKYPNIKPDQSGPLAWFAESIDLRESKVYPNEGSENKPGSLNKAYCSTVNSKKIVKPEDEPVLSKDYADKMLPIIEVRILKAGLRLANLLNKTFSGTAPASQSDSEIIKSLLLNNY